MSRAVRPPLLRPLDGHRWTALRAAIGVTFLLVGSLLAACSSGSSSTPSESTTTTAPAELQYEAHADPAKPITVVAGHRFAVILPADPGAGWRWVMAPIDTALVIPLGSEFRDDPALLARTVPAVTTTTIDPAATTTTRAQAATSTSGSTPDTSAAASTTVTTEAIPLVQVLSFAGKSQGTTAIAFRYERIGDTVDRPITVTFTVTVTPTPPTTTVR